MAKQHFKSFKRSGKGLGLAKRLRLFYEEAGYRAMPIDEFTSAIRAGRYPPGTMAFAVVDEHDRKARFVGTVVIVADDGGLAFEGDANELRAILEGRGS
jgi:hypothetical protein